MNKLIEAVLTDGDGCLYQTMEHITQATLLTAETFAVKATAEAVRNAFSQGLSAQEMFREVAPEADPELFVERFYEFGEQIGYDSITLYPGADFVLNSLVKERRKVALITNRARASTTAIVNQLGIGKLIEDIVAADDGLKAKPDAAGALKALKDLHTLPGRSIMIGDAAGDILMGRNAGVRATLGFAKGFGSVEELQNAGATHLMHYWIELPEIISGLEKNK